jgi:hypothetical protein
MATPGRRFRAVAAGAAGAAWGTYGLFHLRRWATQRMGVPNAVAGLIEDALAVTTGAALLHRRDMGVSRALCNRDCRLMGGLLQGSLHRFRDTRDRNRQSKLGCDDAARCAVLG